MFNSDPLSVMGGSIGYNNTIVCPSKHKLELVNNLPAKYVGQRYCCDRCDKSQSVSVTQPVWHCGYCDYDVCPACATSKSASNATSAINPSQKQFAQGLNGFNEKGNFIWGGAMNLAWNELNRVNGERTELFDFAPKEMLDNFNDGKFSTDDLSAESYYVSSGFGQAAVTKINQESRKKFPKKSFDDLEIILAGNDLICYAYFLKEVQYTVPFSISR